MQNREGMPYVPEEEDKKEDKGRPGGFMKKARNLLGVAAMGAASLGSPSPAEAEPSQQPQTELAPAGEREIAPGESDMADFGIVFEDNNRLRLPDGTRIDYDDLDRVRRANPPQGDIKFYRDASGQELRIVTMQDGKRKEYIISSDGEVKKPFEQEEKRLKDEAFRQGMQRRVEEEAKGE